MCLDEHGGLILGSDQDFGIYEHGGSTDVHFSCPRDRARSGRRHYRNDHCTALKDKAHPPTAAFLTMLHVAMEKKRIYKVEMEWINKDGKEKDAVADNMRNTM